MILDNPRVEIVDVMNNGNMCKVRIHDGATGSYVIKYGEHALAVDID